MAYLRNPRISRILAAVETHIESLASEVPKQISLVELNNDNTSHADDALSQNLIESHSLLENNTTTERLSTETCASTSLLQANEQPGSVNDITGDEFYVADNVIMLMHSRSKP